MRGRSEEALFKQILMLYYYQIKKKQYVFVMTENTCIFILKIYFMPIGPFKNTTTDWAFFGSLHSLLYVMY